MRSSARLVGGMPPSQVSRGPLQWLSPRSLRTRLVAVVLAMNCLAAVLLGVIIVWQARISTKLEINSSLQLADGLAANAVQLMQDAPASVPVPLQLRDIQLHFQSLRHVQIAVRDKSGQQLDDPPAAAAASQPRAVELMEHSPSWFRSLIAPAVESRVFPVVVRGEWLGNVTVTTEPGDEVDEAWDYAYSILASYLLVSSSMLGALFLLFGRVLAPLTHLGLGLKKLVGKNYTVRLPPPALLELDEITYHFNTAAQALALAQQANQDLNRRLLTAHDDERRRTALELHDEAGPCLFALEATAASMSNVKDGLPRSRSFVSGHMRSYNWFGRYRASTGASSIACDRWPWAGFRCATASSSSSSISTRVRSLNTPSATSSRAMATSSTSRFTAVHRKGCSMPFDTPTQIT